MFYKLVLGTVMFLIIKAMFNNVRQISKKYCIKMLKY